MVSFLEEKRERWREREKLDCTFFFLRKKIQVVTFI